MSESLPVKNKTRMDLRSVTSNIKLEWNRMQDINKKKLKNVKFFLERKILDDGSRT